MKRTYIIPLRSAYVNKPKYKKTPTAVRAVKAFLMKHMKVEEVRLGKNLNMAIWTNGIKNPPAKVSVEVEKKDNIAYAELSGKVYHEPTKEDLEAAKESAEKKKSSKKEEAKAEEKKEVALEEEPKLEEKTETKVSESSAKPKKAPVKKATKKVAEE